MQIFIKQYIFDCLQWRLLSTQFIIFHNHIQFNEILHVIYRSVNPFFQDKTIFILHRFCRG